MKYFLFTLLALSAIIAQAQPYVAMGPASATTTIHAPVRSESRSSTGWMVTGGYRSGDWSGELSTTIDTNTLTTLAGLRWFGPFYAKGGVAYLSGDQAVQDPGSVPPVPPGGRPAVEQEKARHWAGYTWVAGIGTQIHLYKNGALRLDAERTGQTGA